MESIVEEAVVRRKGMTLAQLRDILNTYEGVHATATQTDQTSLVAFRETVSRSIGENENGYVSFAIKLF